MEPSFYIKPVMEHEEAVKRINHHTSSKILKLFKGSQKLVSIEQTYLPYWCYDYTLKTSSLKDGIQGKIAIETITKTPAILPSDYPLHPVDAHIKTLPIIGEENPDAAEKAIYWEAFRKEKRKKSIDLTLHSSWILYLPYWIGYLEGKGYEILPLNAVSGNIDLTIKESFLKIFSETG